MPRSNASSELAQILAGRDRGDALLAAATLASSPAVWVPAVGLGIMGLGMLPPSMWDAAGYAMYRSSRALSEGMTDGAKEWRRTPRARTYVAPIARSPAGPVINRLIHSTPIGLAFAIRRATR